MALKRQANSIRVRFIEHDFLYVITSPSSINEFIILFFSPPLPPSDFFLVDIVKALSVHQLFRIDATDRFQDIDTMDLVEQDSTL